MATFRVWSYDVWGNAYDGFEVNDRCNVGSVEIPEHYLYPPANVQSAEGFRAWSDMADKAIVGLLVDAGYLRPRFRIEVESNGDGQFEITHGPTGKPLFGLELDTRH